MIIQEDVPYTNEEVKAMVKTIHDLREQLKQHGWHPASELPKESGVYVVITDFYSCQTAVFAKYDKDKGWDTTDIDNIEWWCYQPEEE